MTLRDFAERYVRTRLGLRESSAVQLRVAVRRLDAWLGRQTQLSDLSADLISSFLLSLKSRSQSLATIQSKRAAILALWRAAAREGLAPQAPEIPRVQAPIHIPEAWTVEEIGRLLAACRSVRGRIGPCRACDWWYAIVLVCYDTGERVGALRAIKRGDWQNGAVIVRAGSQKTWRDRVLPISRQTSDALLALHRHQCRCELLFPWPFRREALWRRFRKLVEAAGLNTPKRRMGLFHRLRRTSGSLVEAAGGDGSRHLGNTRMVFERSYLDPRLVGRGQVDLLPRPNH